MVNKKIHEILTEIALKTYPDVKHVKFYLDIENKEMKSFHGDWSLPSNKGYATIRIFNLSRGTKDIIKTSIHELAHNTEFSIYKKTGHSKRFYEVYKKLLTTAIHMNLFSLNDMDDVDSKHDLDMLIKHHGPITLDESKVDAYKGDIAIVKIKKSFDIKDQLKELDYNYNALEKCWNIEIDKADLESHLVKIKALTPEANIIVTDYSDLKIDTYGYLIVTGSTFDIKDELKSSGFIFNGYNIGANAWVKKILMKDKQSEVNKLKKYSSIKISLKTI